MTKLSIRILDPEGAVVATAEVLECDGQYEGCVDLSDTPDCILAVFTEYEEIVSGQMFSFLDEIEGRIAGLGLRAEFDSGVRYPLVQFQPNPSSSEVAFRLASIPALRI